MPNTSSIALGIAYFCLSWVGIIEGATKLVDYKHTRRMRYLAVALIWFLPAIGCAMGYWQLIYKAFGFYDTH